MQYFLFIRAVNVGQRKMKSLQLKQMLEDLQFQDVGTLLSSGNATFQISNRVAMEKVTRNIEAQIERTFGFVGECFLFTRKALEDIAFVNPFGLSEEQKREFIVNVTFFAAPLSKQTFQEIKALAGDYDDFATCDGYLFWLCRGRRMTDSPVAAALTKLLPTPNTTRKIETIQRLLAKFTQ